MAAPDTEVVDIDGHRLKLTNLDKVMYPETGTTKADIFGYYNAVADVMIPHVRDRIATRKRWVHGVGTPDDPGQVFFQKDLDAASTPDWVEQSPVAHSSGTKTYPLVNDRATLIWLAQIASLEIHVPQWRVGTDGERRNPDRLVLDLDPGEGVTLADCAEVARFARGILTGMGLDPLPVTSGSKGIHLYAALDGSQTSDQVSAVAHELARALEADHPDLIVSDMKKSLRTGKVLVDWSQNNGSKTTIAPYSLRGRFEPTVAAPRTWDELDEPGLRHLDYREVVERVSRMGDPLAGLSSGHGTAHASEPDRLSTYRSMRDATKTPEPVPAERPEAREGRSFVIQEHHARRLHWDFRLEHDGVLVSWALPKGTPTDPKQNHLAVHTEDHPLEYGTFAGDIPHGEYGAGHVDIWDHGDYELEKWRDDEVIATLHGQPDGGLEGVPQKFALIRTARGGDEKNWLIHRMKAEDAEPADAATAPAAPAARSAAPPARTPRPPITDEPVSPMLATLGSAADIGDEGEWAFEMKWDGIRAVAEIRGGRLRLTTRNGNDVTVTYPDLAGLVDLAGEHDLVLDGEIVTLNPQGRPDFGLLQTRMGLTRPGDVQSALTRAPAHYMVFDVLEVDGTKHTRDSYDERRELLFDVLRPGRTDPVQVPPAFDGDPEHAVASSRQLGLEGVMAKRRDSTYSPGRRSRSWIKIKHHLMQEVVIGGWTPGNGRRANKIGALLLGIPDGGTLRYVGKVGTGFSDRALDDLAAKLGSRERKTATMEGVPSADARGAHWVRPDLVGEVEFAEWTGPGRLRQPSWRGLRPDKRADQVVRES
ncbi:ATP-dependent DNA ligase [Leifsonia xyli]|uniref:ATP-dependent DNA ligase n=1 Tax=Leifsonia xyli TaxID=1575 RepID=UPI003D6723D5